MYSYGKWKQKQETEKSSSLTELSSMLSKQQRKGDPGAYGSDEEQQLLLIVSDDDDDDEDSDSDRRSSGINSGHSSEVDKEGSGRLGTNGKEGGRRRKREAEVQGSVIVIDPKV